MMTRTNYKKLVVGVMAKDGRKNDGAIQRRRLTKKRIRVRGDEGEPEVHR